MKAKSRAVVVAMCMLFAAGALVHAGSAKQASKPGSATIGPSAFSWQSVTREYGKDPGPVGRLCLAIDSGDMKGAVSIIVALEGEFPEGKSTPSTQDLISRMPQDKQRALLEPLQDMVKLKGGLFLARLVLAELYVALGQTKGAADTVKTIVSDARGDDAILGELWPVVHDPSMRKSADALGKLIEAPHDTAEQAMSYLRQDKKDSALSAARTLLANWPRSSRAMNDAAYIFGRYEQWVEAARAQELTLKYSRQPLQYQQWTAMGGAYEKAGRFADALSAHRKALSKADTESAVLECYRSIVRMYVRLNRYDSAAMAIVDADRALKDRCLAVQVICSYDIEGLDERVLLGSLERVLVGKSRLSAAKLTLGSLYRKAGRIDDARLAFAAAYRDANGEPYAGNSITEQCIYEDGLRDLGLQIGASNYATNPDMPYVALAALRAYVISGKESDALDVARRITTKWPQDPSLMANTADELTRIRQWDAAIEAQTKSVASSKDLTEAMSLKLAGIYREAGRTSEAIDAYARVVATGKDKSLVASAQAELIKMSAEQGVALNDPGSGAKAIIDADRAGRTSVLMTVLSGLLPRTAAEAASAHDQNRGLADALSARLRSESGLVDSRIVLASLYEACNEQDVAREVLSKALPSAKTPDILLLFSHISLNKRDYASAISALETMRILKPDDYNVRQNLGSAYLASGDVAKAVEQAAIMVRDWPNEPWSLFYAGMILLQSKDWKGAIDAFSRSLKAGDEVAQSTGKEIKGLRWSDLSGLEGAYEGCGDLVRERQVLGEILVIIDDAKARQDIQTRIDSLESRMRQEAS